MMSYLSVLFALTLFIGAFALLEQKERPVSKVINLLKEMKDTLEKEGEEDQKVYDTMACWCETNEQSKTKAVADGIRTDKKLTALIPELAAKQATLKVETEQLQKEMKANEEALAEATEIRAKELSEFRTEETTSVQSITGLKNAVLAISKNHALNQETLLQVRAMMERHSARFPQADFAALRGKRVIASLLQLSGPVPASSNPQSGEIFGILKGMKESFEANLANSQQEEKADAQSYLELKAAKSEEISAALTQIENKIKENASAGEKREQSKEDLEDTRAQVTADQAFLLDLQSRCGSMDKQFADRTKVRQEETNAVNEALKILTDDDARDLMSKSTGFLQLSASTKSAGKMLTKREQALTILRRSGNPELAMLAITLKDDVFVKIKATIDDLTANLKKEQADEVAQRDECIDDLNTNEKELAGKLSEQKDKETDLEELNLAIERLKDEMEVAKAEIDDTKKEMLKASENRELQNKDFQTAVTEQRATQQILQKALKKLQAFYDAKAAALLQVHGTTSLHRAGQAPPPGFAPMKKSEGAGGVMGMIENIIAESEQAEADAVAGEKEAQAAYETFMKDSKDAIAKLEKSINDKTRAMEKADADRIHGEKDLRSIKEDLSGLESMRTQLHSSCDFLLKNYEVRQAARTGEMEALAEAKALMSGASA